MNQLPTIGNISKIVNAIHAITELPISKIQEDLLWNSGPYINIVDPTTDNSSRTDVNTVGWFSKDNPEELNLSSIYVEALENNSMSQEQRDALMFWLGVTILHEYVHLGDHANGDIYQFDPGVPDEGDMFEFMAYGEDLNGGSAEYYLLNKKN